VARADSLAFPYLTIEPADLVVLLMLMPCLGLSSCVGNCLPSPADDLVLREVQKEGRAAHEN
jgi:hypothetical protein